MGVCQLLTYNKKNLIGFGIEWLGAPFKERQLWMGKTSDSQLWMLFKGLLSVLYPRYWMNATLEWLLGDRIVRKHLDRGVGILGSLQAENDIPAKGLHQDWMTGVPDTTSISQMSIPGTHDSAAYNYQGEGKEFWNCQVIPLFRQLDAGIRALDLRYGLRDGKLLFFHATALLDGQAEVVDIIWGLHAWLKQHPTETIFVSLKVDNGLPKAPDVQAAMDVVMRDTYAKNIWVPDLTTSTTLSAARGKLILVRRFPFTQKIGFSVSEDWKVNLPCFRIPLDENTSEENKSSAWIEDFYLLKDLSGKEKEQIKIKYDYTETHLNKAQEALAESNRDLWITFSSAVGDRKSSATEDVTPRVMALGRGSTDGVNQKLIEWCGRTSKRPVGIVFMDFVNIKRSENKEDKVEPDFDLIRAFIEKQGEPETA